MSEITIIVGQRIRQYRQQAGLSQDVLAEKSRIARDIHRAVRTR